MATKRMGPAMRVAPRHLQHSSTEITVFYDRFLPRHPVCLCLIMGEATANICLTPEALRELTQQLIAADELTRAGDDQLALPITDAGAPGADITQEADGMNYGGTA